MYYPLNCKGKWIQPPSRTWQGPYTLNKVFDAAWHAVRCMLAPMHFDSILAQPIGKKLVRGDSKVFPAAIFWFVSQKMYFSRKKLWLTII